MPLIAILAALLVALCWGGNYSATKFALMDFPPVLALLLRFIGITIVMFPFALRRPIPKLRDMAVISFLLIVLQFTLLFSSLHSGLSVTSVIVASQLGVPFACVMAAMFYKDYLGPWRSFGLVVAFLGVMIVAGTPDAASHWGAFLLAVGAALSWSAGNLYLKRMGALSLTDLLFWPGVMAVPQLLVLTLVMESNQLALIQSAHWLSWGCILYSLIFSSLVGYGLWYWLIGKYPMSQVMPYALLMPIFGVAFGVVLFDEPLTTQVLIGTALTIAGVTVISIRRPKLVQPEP